MSTLSCVIPALEQPITVAIADDQALVRAGLRVILENELDISVVAEAANGREAIDVVAPYAPEVVLMDVQMPVLDGLEAARQILTNSGARVLMLTTFDDDEYIFRALEAGASGFMLKDSPASQLVGAVRTVASGDALLDPSITRRLIGVFVKALRPTPGIPERLQQLTERELEVFGLVAQGLSNSEIAARLVVGENTVKTHVSRILMKLELRDRVQAVVLAYECGFVASDAP
jgi:DNA-binding NarL/FixJ family response regulator